MVLARKPPLVLQLLCPPATWLSTKVVFSSFDRQKNKEQFSSFDHLFTKVIYFIQLVVDFIFVEFHLI
jgi:hypothetical protein